MAGTFGAKVLAAVPRPACGVSAFAVVAAGPCMRLGVSVALPSDDGGWAVSWVVEVMTPVVVVAGAVASLFDAHRLVVERELEMGLAVGKAVLVLGALVTET